MFITKYKNIKLNIIIYEYDEKTKIRFNQQTFNFNTILQYLIASLIITIISFFALYIMIPYYILLPNGTLTGDIILSIYGGIFGGISYRLLEKAFL